MDVKKVAHELSGRFAKVELYKQLMTAAILPEIFAKPFLSQKVLIEIYYEVIANNLIYIYDYINAHSTEKLIKKYIYIWVILTDSTVVGSSSSPPF